MVSSAFQAECVLEELRRGLPALAPTDERHLDARRVLLRLAEAWPDLPAGGNRQDLEALCREISVRRRVLADYGPGWKRGDVRESLPEKWWPLLVGVLLSYSVSAAKSDECARGLALKCLNAALGALDIADDLGVSIPADLAAWADDILETIPGEWAT